MLNGTAAYVWERLSGRAAPGDIALEISAGLDAPLTRVRSDVAALVRQWRAVGLLRSVRTREPPRAAPGPLSDSSSIAARSELRAVAPKRYRILDSEFELRADPRVALLIDAHIAHFPAKRSTRRGRCRELAVFAAGGKWILTLDGEVLGECAEETEVIPLVHANLGILAYHESGCLAALHAAAVAREGRCVLLPAASGSGKSTLAAALAARGYAYCADDLAVLAAGRVGLRPVPFKVGLKEGSWLALEPFAPAIAALPTFRRADGKLVRYWLPETAVRPEHAATLAIAAVVFPSFRQGAGTELRALARSDAFLRIAAAGYDLPGGLDRARVGDLVAWIRGVSCYELEYGDLNDAIGAFEAVLR